MKIKSRSGQDNLGTRNKRAYNNTIDTLDKMNIATAANVRDHMELKLDESKLSETIDTFA